jgi:3-keto-disaccharide hydrolase
MFLATTTLYAFTSDDAAPNTLTDKEKADGWKLLFDGKTTSGWRAVKKDKAPDGWQAVDSALVRVKGGGDIITEQEFENFELLFDWKVTEGANSGVFFRVNEDYGVIQSPEYQVLHNQKHTDGRNPKTSAASNYALHAPTKDLTKPVGEWNQGKIVVNGNHVEHWLNGQRVVAYELWSDEWKSLVAESKFKDMQYYGKSPKGHIALQDHGDRVEYRNMKIKTLPPKN